MKRKDGNRRNICEEIKVKQDELCIQFKCKQRDIETKIEYNKKKRQNQRKKISHQHAVLGVCGRTGTGGRSV